MTQQIERKDWKEFFDRLSRERLDWETSVQVLADETGAQYLNQGLPFVGATFEENPDRIELIVGSGAENHQTHTIFGPQLVAFETNGAAGTLDIEDENGTKTLIKFTGSLPEVITYSETEAISSVSKAT